LFALNYKTVKDQINILGCTRRTFALLTGISERHIYRLEKQSVKPNTRSKEVIEKVEELCAILVEIFDSNEARIKKWLNKPNKSINNTTPLRYIMGSTSEKDGIEQIIDLLQGFKLGITN
jgi:uncharacterized protein (DUF2384 family)